MGPKELGLPMDSDDESTELSSESSSDDIDLDSRVPLATVPFTIISNGKSSRS